MNIAIYVPLGMSAHLAFRRFRAAGPVLLGALLSAAVEMTQLFTPHRDCSAYDLVNNTLGSALGVAAGMVFERIAGPVEIGGHLRRAADRAALALLFCWIVSLEFPLFPVVSLPVYRNKFAQFAGSPALDPLPLLSAAGCWFVAGRLLERSGLPKPRRWLAFSLLAIPAQFFIVTRQPRLSDAIGAAAGVVLFLAFGGGKLPVAWAFLGLLLARGLTPYHPASAPADFLWIPFGGFLNMDWQAGIRVLLEKMFYYGSAIWLLRVGGFRPVAATAVVAILLAGIEIAQRWLPGHVAEITDPLLALLAGFGFWAIRSAASAPDRSAAPGGLPGARPRSPGQ